MFINPTVLMKVLFFQRILLINVEIAMKSVYSGVHKNCYNFKERLFHPTVYFQRAR